MGKTLLPLVAAKIPKKTIFDKRFVIECCETFHFHWRNLRLELTHENFLDFVATFEQALHNWRNAGSPSSAPHFEMGRMRIANPICTPDDFKIEVCENLYKTHETSKDSHFLEEDTFVHMHYRDLRVEMANNDFLRFAGTVRAACDKFNAHSLHSVEALLQFLDDNNILYVVLRNWENLPDNIEVGPHSDLDLLIHPQHVGKFDSLWRGMRTQKEPYRVQRKIPVLGPNGDQTYILVDLRTTDDGYYPGWFSHRLLSRREKYRNFYVPSSEDHFLALLYHVVYHKGVMGKDYAEKLVEVAGSAGMSFDAASVNALGYCASILKQQHLDPVEPTDLSVLPKLPFIHPVESVLYSRQLTVHDGIPYQSRIYLLEENGTKRVVKQATSNLAQLEHYFLSRLSGAHFPRVYESKSQDGYSTCEMEFVEGYPLTNIDRFCAEHDSASVKHFIRECIDIVGELQEREITHRDIRAENILVREGHPVLIDFGWATSAEVSSFVPDGLGNEGRPSDGSFDDVYSMGVVVAALALYYPEFVDFASLMADPDPLSRVRDVEVLRKELEEVELSRRDFKNEYMRLADTLFKSGQAEKGDAVLTRYLAKNTRQADVLVKRAELRLSLNRQEEARGDLVEALAVEPGFESARYSLAALLMNEGENDAAFEQLRLILKTNPMHALALNDSGVIAFQQQQCDEAVEYFRRAIAADSNCIAARKNLADVLTQSGQREKAIEQLLTIVKITPDDIEAQTELACLYLQEQQFEDALVCFRKLAKVNPAETAIQEMVKALEEQLGLVTDGENAIGEEVSSPCEAVEKVREGGVPPGVEVSIIIPVFGNVDYTRKCLEGIYTSFPPKRSFEIIVVDDCSTDETADFLSEVSKQYKNCRFISLDQNGGFARACNAGAVEAKGKYLFFLNNDTVPKKQGWLDALVDVVEKNPAAGIAGSKLVFPDTTQSGKPERVQHCGIAFNDQKGSLHLYKFCLAGQPFVNRERTVQAVTGAALFISKTTFKEVNGFDTKYKNGGEDLDLCFKVRRIGKEVVYCPQSELYHFESVSIRNAGQEGHNASDNNYKLFLDRWENDIISDEYAWYKTDELACPDSDLPRLAMVAPLAPLKTGIADHVQELLPNLSRHARVDLFVDDYVPSHEDVFRKYLVHSITDLEYVNWIHRYDQIIYHLGNNRFHTAICDQARKMPGIAVVHEYEIKGCSAEPNNRKVLETVLRQSTGIVVHNQHSYNLLHSAFPDKPIRVIPLLLASQALDAAHQDRDGVRERLHIPREAFVILSLGLVQPHKRNHVTVAAFAEFSQSHPDAVLILGGEPASPQYKAYLDGLIRQHGLQSKVRITGWLSEDDFFAYMSAADVTVNLRYPSRGEESASLIQVLGCGKPALVSSYAQYQEFPDDSVVKIGFENEVEEIVQSLVKIHDNPVFARELSARARAFVHERNDVGSIARQYAEYALSVKNIRAVPRVQQQSDATILWEGPVWAMDDPCRELALALHRHGAGVAVRPLLHRADPQNVINENDAACLKELEQKPLADKFIQVFPGPLRYFERRTGASFVVVMAHDTDKASVRRLGKPDIDAVWVPSRHVRTKMIAAGVNEHKVKIVPYGVGTLDYGTNVAEQRQDDPFVFLCMTDWSARSGWESVFSAFVKEFKGDPRTCLLLRSLDFRNDVKKQQQQFDELTAKFIRAHRDIPSEYYNAVRIDYRTFDANMMPLYYAGADAVVQPYTDSYFGRPVLEALATGLPVITTTAGGQADYVSETLSYVVRQRKRGGTTGIDEDHLRELMRHIADNRLTSRWKGSVARSTILSRYTWDVIAKAVLDDMRQIEGVDIHGRPSTQAAITKSDLSAFSAENFLPERTDIGKTPEGKTPVLWFAPFYNPSGYASEAIQFVESLSNEVPLRIYHANTIYSSQFVAGLPADTRTTLQQLDYTRSLNGLPFKDQSFWADGPIVVCHQNPLGFFRNKDSAYCIGRTMFETDRIPEEWVERCNQMDEVWVPTEFNMQTFAKSGVSRQKLMKIPGSINSRLFDPATTPAFGIENTKQFNFLSVFEWSARKGWDILLRAYFSEFSASDDVCLFLRTSFPMHPDLRVRDEVMRRVREFADRLGRERSSLPAIEVIDDQIATSELPALYKTFDAFVLPSRGEGWGRPFMEAMAMELPVIGTDWSGNTEFMNQANSYLIKSDGLCDVDKMENPIYTGHKWANPSINHLRKLMRHVIEHQEEAKEKGRQARRDIVEHYSQTRVSEIIINRLNEIKTAIVSRQTDAIQPAGKKSVAVVWEGTPFAHHSLSVINRELCAELLVHGCDMSVVPFGEDDFKPGKNSRFAAVQARRNKSLSSTDIHVRHHWPPNLTPPGEGRWVVMQPWEFGSLPKSWVEAFASRVDEVWAYTEYVRQVYISSGIPAERVHIVPPGFDPGKFHPDVRPFRLKTKKHFRFLFVGGTIYRKGIDILLETYTQTFRSTDDVCLVIKDMGGDSFYKGQTFRDVILELQKKPGMPEIQYIDEILSEQELAGLYTACNVLVHPYRGEGFGMPILESMACGTPAIVTNGGAVLDFCNQKNSILVSASRLQLPSKYIGHDETVDFPWLLEVNRKELAERMTFAVQHADDLKTLGQQASKDAHSQWTWKHAGAKCRKRIDELSNKPILRFSQQQPGDEYLQEKLGKSLDLFRLGRFKDSLAELLDPGAKVSDNASQTSQTDHANLRGACYLRLNDMENAKASFEEALNLTPDSSEACAGLGEVLYLCGKDKEAKVMFEYAVVYDEENTMATNGLAKVNEHLGLPSDENSLIEYVTANK
ncbi:MAG: glycosyltransferase [Bacteroidetes bacterium]|nr:glycosyltransferase [Bacteroidota bacterium]MCW5895137.1 glycosyltransferase [Bacteroidota bacterium]